MQKKLLLIGGVVNALFVVFHLLMGIALHKPSGLPADTHALLQMLNVGGSLFILFFTLAFLAYPVEVVNTRVGRLSLLFCVFLYGTRAVEEIFWAPVFSPVIFSVCMVTTILFTGIFISTFRSRIVQTKE